jgi:molecular chaperone DnaK
MSTQIDWTSFLSARNKTKINENAKSTFVGIDFGTSTTVVSIATIDQSNGELVAKHIALKQPQLDGSVSTDYRVNSAVAWVNQKKLLIGRGAYDIAYKLKKNINYWQSFKMELGTDVGCAYPKSELLGTEIEIINPKDVARLFFFYLKKQIENHVAEENLPPNIKYTVTIPASFESNQRIDLLQCLENANISVEESCLIDEPNAAFLSYFLDGNRSSKDLSIPENYNPNLLVFDFGAGTCDISILELGENHRGVYSKNIAISQYSEIGGDNIDEQIVKDHLIPTMMKQSDKSVTDFRKKEIDELIIPRLLASARRLKEMVSERIEVYPEILNLEEKELQKQTFNINHEIRIDTRKGDLCLDQPALSLLDFINVSRQFCFDVDFVGINKEINPVFSALNKANFSPDDIDYILFIGGSSKNLVIRNQVKSVFPKVAVLLPRDLQSHVSKGAAIHSLFINQFNTNIIQPISNERIYIKINNEGQEERLTIVESGATIPFAPMTTDDFRPQRDGQNIIEIPIYVGNDDKELSKIELHSDNNAGFKMNQSIELTISIDINKVMICQAKIGVNTVEIKCKNPYSSSGKTVKDSIYHRSLKEFNLATKDHKGITPLKNYEKLVNVYEKNENFLDAAELLEEAIEQHNVKYKFNKLGLLYSEAGHDNKAVQYYELAFENSPSASFAFNLGNTYLHIDREKALKYLKKSIELEPDKPNALFLLGRELKKQGEDYDHYIDKAFDIYQKRYAAKQMNSWDYSWFSSLARHKGKYDLAKQIENSEPTENDASKFYDKDNLMSKTKIINQ